MPKYLPVFLSVVLRYCFQDTASQSQRCLNDANQRNIMQTNKNIWKECACDGCVWKMLKVLLTNKNIRLDVCRHTSQQILSWLLLLLLFLSLNWVSVYVSLKSFILAPLKQINSMFPLHIWHFDFIFIYFRYPKKRCK